VHHVPQDWRTPLHGAAIEGHVDVCKLLLAAGANVNTQGRVNSCEVECTPLHTAAKYGHVEVCELLLAAGADVNTQDIVSCSEV
jgi:ankyrin repeat protein